MRRSSAADVDDKRFVVKIAVDGETEIVESPTKKLGLRWMQEHVGGYIQLVRLKPGLTCVVDEEGRVKARPQNVRVPCLVGTVLICAERGAHLLGLTVTEAAELVIEMDRERDDRADEKA